MAHSRSPTRLSVDNQSLKGYQRADTLPLASRQEGVGFPGKQQEFIRSHRQALPARVRRSSCSVSDLHRNYHQGTSASQNQQTPLLQRLLGSQFSVLNPYSSFDVSNSSINLNPESQAQDFEPFRDLDEPFTRASILSIFRPEKLIGHYDILADWKDFFVSDLSLVKNKRVRSFYHDQNELIRRFSEIDHFLDYGKMHLNMLTTYTNPHGHDDDNSKSRINEYPGNIRDGGQFLGFDEEKSSSQVVLAIMVNFVINFFLMLGKLVISLLTNSLSVVASLVDSILDFLSTFIIYVANRLSTSKSWRTKFAYPIGRTKLEPLGILIFSVIIIISFFQVGLESFKKLFLDKSTDKQPAQIGWDAISIMLVTIIAKIWCWWWCSLSKSSSVQALAQDAVTDIMFNTISLIVPAAGHLLDVWWFDPLGALLLSLYIMIIWGQTAFEHIDKLTGAVADPDDYKVILYLAYRFAECIKQITALKAYHAGDKLTVEIDVVFDTENFDVGFKDAHDIAEALQYAIETLPMVERAFVHIDYMEGNFKGHLT
ncbi:cation efflux family protein [Metschnikowia bicuspidata var. bicuspidata NRRL YB-4993]|uniref:Cation efflux family protein n=1 Tax=Metschnikowia bicuspidata var. bicuspidata NRRL YB-4993 TaxID=869754 RepID=A0A1A0H5P4_9ASCO|nr:cation efflux family protein [Metschnikowia bicuspidata var. bicuspidata NRRL YB-4993]OBA19227.1 cation efflux family protein [Metschnikowia bicuspidata var. bicuspidata NRRL YB-4993]